MSSRMYFLIPACLALLLTAACAQKLDTATNTVTKKVKSDGGPWGIQIVSKETGKC